MSLNLFPPQATGNVTGPASATSGHVAVFSGTSGKILADGGALFTGGSQIVANSAARLALTGKPQNYSVYQTDNGFTYILTNPAAPSDAASWQAVPKVYGATLTGGVEEPPTVVAPSNTVGAIVWVNVGPGLYQGTLADTFTGTVLLFSGSYWDDNQAAAFLFGMSVVNTSVVMFTSHRADGVASDLGNKVASIRIEVYPA